VRKKKETSPKNEVEEDVASKPNGEDSFVDNPTPQEEKPKPDMSEEKKDNTTEETVEKSTIISTKPTKVRQNSKLDMSLDAYSYSLKAGATTSWEKPNTLFIKTVPPTCSRQDLLSVLNRVEGGEVEKLVLSDASPHRNFHRIGWVTYSTPEACLHALKELNNFKMQDFDLMLIVHRPHEDKKLKITPTLCSDDERSQKDLNQARSLTKRLDKDYTVTKNPLFSEDETEGEDKLSSLEKLDRFIGYLRKVHCFCYYCGEEYSDEDELEMKCGPIHLRGTETCKYRTDIDPVYWTNKLDSKIKFRLDHPNDPKIFMGDNEMEASLQKFYNKNVEEIEKDKVYMCNLCEKKFKGEEYVKKHLNNKHKEDIEDVKRKAIENQFYLNYMADQKRLQLVGQASYNKKRRDNREYDDARDRRGAMGYRERGMERGTPYRRPNTWGVPPPPYSYSAPGPQRRSRSRSFRFTPMDGRAPSREQQPVQPGYPRDPREIPDFYKDLDKPKEDLFEIDYSRALEEYTKNKQNKEKES